MSTRSCSSCSHDVLEHVPRRRVGPLHVVEHDRRAGARRRARADTRRSRRTARTCCRSARAPSAQSTSARHETRQLAPIASSRRRPSWWIAPMTSAHGAYGGLASASLQRPATSEPARSRTSCREPAHERRFADAGFADDRDDVAAGARCVASRSRVSRRISSSRPTNCLRLIAGSCEPSSTLGRGARRCRGRGASLRRARGRPPRRARRSPDAPARAGARRSTASRRSSPSARAAARRRGAPWRECARRARAASSSGGVRQQDDEFVAGVAADDRPSTPRARAAYRRRRGAPRRPADGRACR